YDAPRKQDDEIKSDSIEELKAQRSQAQASKIDEDETAVAEGFELPGADLSNEELSVRVLPKQNDEFTCMECCLVRHRSQLASGEAASPFCTDCAGGVASLSPQHCAPDEASGAQFCSRPESISPGLLSRGRGLLGRGRSQPLRASASCLGVRVETSQSGVRPSASASSMRTAACAQRRMLRRAHAAGSTP